MRRKCKRMDDGRFTAAVETRPHKNYVVEWLFEGVCYRRDLYELPYGCSNYNFRSYTYEMVEHLCDETAKLVDRQEFFIPNISY